jgi:hypothetical protein
MLRINIVRQLVLEETLPPAVIYLRIMKQIREATNQDRSNSPVVITLSNILTGDVSDQEVEAQKV